MSEELRACHFEHHAIEGMGFVEPTNQDPHWYATCCDCGARGPGCGTRLIAIKSWNTRPLEDELLTALEEATDDIEEETEARYPMKERLAYPDQQRRYERDMEQPQRYRALIAKAKAT